MANEGDGSPLIIKPPSNIGESQQLARDLWAVGKKPQAIGAICDCIKLLSAGIRRQFMDYEELKKSLAEQVEENNELKRRVAKLEELQRPK